MDNYKAIKLDLERLRTIVEKSELWVVKKSGSDKKKDKKKDKKDDKKDKEEKKDGEEKKAKDDKKDKEEKKDKEGKVDKEEKKDKDGKKDKEEKKDKKDDKVTFCLPTGLPGLTTFLQNSLLKYIVFVNERICFP